MGIRGSSTYELIFEDCRIPKDALLGQEGRGFPIAMHTLDGGRIGIAAQALGIAEGALDRCIEYTKERKQFGRSIAQQQNTQFKLADMAARIEAAQLLVYKAAMAKATQKVYSVEAAKAKLFAAETAMAVTTEVVQLFGRAYDARCQDHRDLRRNFRSSAYGYFWIIIKIIVQLCHNKIEEKEINNT